MTPLFMYVPYGVTEQLRHDALEQGNPRELDGDDVAEVACGGDDMVERPGLYVLIGQHGDDDGGIVPAHAGGRNPRHGGVARADGTVVDVILVPHRQTSETVLNSPAAAMRKGGSSSSKAGHGRPARARGTQQGPAPKPPALSRLLKLRQAQPTGERSAARRTRPAPNASKGPNSRAEKLWTANATECHIFRVIDSLYGNRM
jgi:hypothetical protein